MIDGIGIKFNEYELIEILKWFILFSFALKIS